MKLVIIDYGAGNIQSIKFAIKRLGYDAVLSNDADEIRNADKVIFPGVGEASSAMKKLRERELDKLIPTLKQPVLGICLGMQLMCKGSEEGNTKGLGIFDVDVVKFGHQTPERSLNIPQIGCNNSPQTPKGDLKIPQIGWNKIYDLKGDLFQGLAENHVYLVHSYYASLCEDTIAITDYGLPYSAALQKDNFYGTQFHPEKSGDYGSEILENFLSI